MKRVVVLLAFVLVVAACGDDDAASTTVALAGSTSSTAATTVTPSSTVAPSTTAAAPVAIGPTDCLEIWPEALVQDVAGTSFTFFAANADNSACTYTALPDGIALAWRDSDEFGYEESKRGAGVTSPVMDAAVCDAGFFTVLQDAIVIMEGYSASQGRAYNATITGSNVSNSETWALTLIEAACQ